MYLIAMVGNQKVPQLVLLSPIELIFDMKVRQDDKHQPHTLLLC